MSQRAQATAERIKSFGDEVMAFVANLSEGDWGKICDWEQWPVGVTARHIGVAHLTLFKMVDTIVKGEPLPPMTIDQINEGAKKDSQAHADCTKEEVLDLLQKNGARMVSYISGLSDDDLDRAGDMPAFGGAVTADQIIDYVIFRSAQRHFESMKTAVAR